MHIFLTGDVQVGKSTIIKKTLGALHLQTLGGFRSVSVPDLPDGAMSVYLSPSGEAHPAMGDWNRVGIRKGCGRGIEKFPEAFERAGVQALENAETKPLILMDEVGRMESAAARFSERILALLEGSTPILGVVQKIADTPLTNAIRRHPNVRIVEVSLDNREEKAQEVLTSLDEDVISNLPATLSSGKTQILVGPENVAKELKDSSVVITKFDIGDGMQGMIGVVGPTRMDYAKITARLSYFAENLGRMFAKPQQPALHEPELTEEPKK